MKFSIEQLETGPQDVGVRDVYIAAAQSMVPANENAGVTENMQIGPSVPMSKRHAVAARRIAR